MAVRVRSTVPLRGLGFAGVACDALFVAPYEWSDATRKGGMIDRTYGVPGDTVDVAVAIEATAAVDKIMYYIGCHTLSTPK